MAPRSRAAVRAALLAAVLARAAAAGEPSCGQDEVCAPQDVEAVEEASMDALRVELLQSRGKLLPAGDSAKQAAPENSLVLGDAITEPAKLTTDALNASLLQSASGDMPSACRDLMRECGCRDLPTDGSKDSGGRAASEIGTDSDVYYFMCSGNSVCFVYERSGGIGDLPSSVCPYPSTKKERYYTTDQGQPAIARLCCGEFLWSSSPSPSYDYDRRRRSYSPSPSYDYDDYDRRRRSYSPSPSDDYDRRRRSYSPSPSYGNSYGSGSYYGRGYYGGSSYLLQYYDD